MNNLSDSNKTAFFDILMKLNPYPIIFFDDHYRVVSYNDAFVDLLGCGTDHFKDRFIYDCFPNFFIEPDHQFNARVEEYQIGDHTVYLRPLLKEDIVDGKKIRVLFFEDISERIETERELEIVFADLHQSKFELEKTMQELQRSNDELQQFAYVASHDLKEPLRTISSYLQLLERRYKGKFDQDADDFIQFTVDASKRMDKLINNLLLYSRVHSRAKEFEWIDCNDLMIDVMSRLVVLLEEKKAIVNYDQLPNIFADRNQIALLFQNLITNGIKFQNADSLAEIQVGAEERENEWIFSVKDNGIGIEERNFKRIFTIFQRLHTTDEYPGSGMGLSIAKRIVQRHRGRIWINSEIGIGTTFFFTIPKPETE